MVKLALYYLKDEQESIDLVQELFVHLWENPTNLSEVKNHKAYLYTAVRNRCYNKINRSPTLFNSMDLLENEPVDQFDFTELIQTKELENQLMEAIDQLPDKCKEIFVLSRFKDLSYKEIAELLSVSVKTVENQISNALRVLRKYR